MTDPPATEAAARTDTNELAHSTADLTAAVSALNDDVDRLSARLSDFDVDGIVDPVFQDPDLVDKVVHACVTSVIISETEELRIIEAPLE